MHSIDELFKVAVDGDDDQRWAAIQDLRLIGDAVVVPRALTLCRSGIARMRAAGAEILGQFAESSVEAAPALESMFDDESSDVVAAAVLAIAQQGTSGAIDSVTALAGHPDGKVRWALVTALEASVADERALRVLLRLMSDCDVDVRDRATFAIGSLSEADSPRVRSALAERLRDESASVAREAALGLARRRDARAILYIARAVEVADEEIEEAAEEITAPEMLHELVKARTEAGDDPGIDALIARCRARL